MRIKTGTYRDTATVCACCLPINFDVGRHSSPCGFSLRVVGRHSNPRWSLTRCRREKKKVKKYAQGRHTCRRVQESTPSGMPSFRKILRTPAITTYTLRRGWYLLWSRKKSETYMEIQQCRLRLRNRRFQTERTAQTKKNNVH